MLALDYAFAGLGLGAIAALSGVGLLITYRATGVFNIAHGATAMLAAFLFWQLQQWGLPGALAAVLVLGVFAPGFGVVVERYVFRPLQRRFASPAESLVATIGLLVLLFGIAFEVWGAQARRAPSLFPTSVLHAGSVVIHVDALWSLAALLVGVGVLGAATQLTPLGTQIRAVVDRRDLAELSAVDADRVSAFGWATGSVVAALTGILLAPQLSLDPIALTLVVLETFAVPVIAGLTSIPVAIAAGLALGIAGAEMNLYTPSGNLMDLWNALHANLAIVLLLLALLVRNRLAEASSGDAGSAGTLARRRSGEGSAARQAVQYTTATLLLVAPLLFDPVSLREAEKVPALGIIFVSIVAVTGYSGQISLGQAGYAGLGALFCAKFSGGTPELVALLFGMLAAGIVGFLTGYPAIRRRGLFLALTTFAVGAVVSRFVFQQTFFTSGVRVHRPSLFGLTLTGDHAFYGFELAMLALTFLVMRNLQSGPLGRSLIAVRDSEDGARSIGVDVRVLKMFIFTVSAVLAGLGGALLAQQAQTFNPNDFDPLQGSLFWFAAVVVFGADSAAGAIAAAGFVVLVDAVAGRSGTAEIAIGALAAFVGFMPGGAAEAARRIVDVVVTPTGLMRRFTATVPASRPAPELSPGGRVALQRLHARRREASR